VAKECLCIVTGLSTCLGIPPVQAHNDNIIMIHDIIIINIDDKILYIYIPNQNKFVLHDNYCLMWFFTYCSNE